MQIRVKENTSEFGKCGCGRSPTGYCIGWHSFTEKQLKEAQDEWESKMTTPMGQEVGTCGCGRSPTGKCLGLHALTEDEWIGGKTQILANIAMGRGKIGIEKPVGEPE